MNSKRVMYNSPDTYKFPLVCAIAGSLFLNALMINRYDHWRTFSNIESNKDTSIESSNTVNISFVETEYEIPEAPIEAEYLSDKHSQSDSSKQGNVESPLPEARTKDVITQKKQVAKPDTATRPRLGDSVSKQQRVNVDAIKVQSGDEISIQISDETATQSSDESGTNIEQESLLQTEKQEKTEEVTRPDQGEDNFPAPMISIGEKTISVEGLDSFDAEGSALGKYLKQLRDTIGYQFYKMVFFQYRSTYIFSSEAYVSFEVREDGSIQNIQGEWVKGDPLFLKYCEAVVNEAAPFEALHTDIKPYTRKGVLKINRFLFGYSVSKEG